MESQPGDGPRSLVSEGAARAGPVSPDHLLLPCADPHAPATGKAAPRGQTDQDARTGLSGWVTGSPSTFSELGESYGLPSPASTLPCPLGQCQPTPPSNLQGPSRPRVEWDRCTLWSHLTFALRWAAHAQGLSFTLGCRTTALSPSEAVLPHAGDPSPDGSSRLFSPLPPGALPAALWVFLDPPNRGSQKATRSPT